MWSPCSSELTFEKDTGTDEWVFCKRCNDSFKPKKHIYNKKEKHFDWQCPKCKKPI